MLGAMSHDGEHWSYGEPKELNPDVWNRGDVQAGLAAISTSSKPFVPVYSGYSIQQGSKAEPGEAEKKE
jgi:hypothetical protein